MPRRRAFSLLEQLVKAEHVAARYHDDFVAQCEDVLAASSYAFWKAVKQDRAAAQKLQRLR